MTTVLRFETHERQHMRLDYKVPSWLRQPRHKQPVRTATLIKGSLVALTGALIITTLSPVTAEAATKSYIEINRINSRLVVEGHFFPKNAKGIAKIRVAGIYEEKKVKANSGGYFRVTFYKVKPSTAGKAWAGTWINNKIRRTAEKKIKAVSSGSNGGSGGSNNGGSGGTGGGSTPKPPTTTTTAAPRPTTTTTVKPTTTTTVKPTTTTTRPTTTTTAKPPSGGGGKPADNGGASNKWRLAVQDDFNGSKINGNLWGLYEGSGNEGVGQRKRSAVTVSGGSAHINGKGWVGGGMAMREHQTYGKYEIRSRMDNGAGYNKAELLWPTSERWPRDVEVDISEIFDGNYDEYGSFVHYGSDNKRLHNIMKNVDTTKWHTYGVEWESNKLTYLLDGKVIWTVTESAAIPHNKHFLGIQLDVSRNSHKVDTSLHIDYVKVWERA